MSTYEKDVYLAIIAGGQGTRLFPLSHPDCPKQFCVLREDGSGSVTFIQDTAKRFMNVGVRPQNVVVITTNDRQEELAKEQLVPLGVIEPNIIQVSADYGYASSMLKATEFCSHLNSEAIVINTPSDQYIEGDNFENAIVAAINNVRSGHPTIVGVKINDLNTFTGCGHARYDNTASGPIYKIDGFVEKPSKEKAISMMRADNTACNTGINVWRAKDVLSTAPMTEVEARLAVYRERCKQGDQVKIENFQIGTAELMGKFPELHLVVCNFKWFDCGTLKSFYTIQKKTPHHKNASIGEVYRTGCLNSLFITQPGIKLFATDIQDCAVVVNVINGKIYIVDVDMEYSQQVRELVEKYSSNKELLLKHFSLYGAYNNILVETNLSPEVCCGFIGPRASKHQVVPIKLPDNQIIIQVSGQSFEAKTA
ncbi:hypothetical protein IJJ46_02605 [Candidatus Saccharibacteria bacterium]|nr:hypothetical protein [Candidatus Saccharibacteria bacterium]